MFYLSFLLLTMLTEEPKNVFGTYSSLSKARKESWSIITLFKDSTFKYSYGVGGCQGEVKGKYSIQKNCIFFRNDHEFTQAYLDSTGYDYSLPDLSTVRWKINEKRIKPLDDLMGACGWLKDKHLKIRED